MIKAILTDLGNVVVFFDRQKVSENIAALVSQPFETIESVLNGPGGVQLLQKFEVWAINEEEYVTELERRFGCRLPREEFWRCHTVLFEPNYDVIKLYQAIRRERPDTKLVAVTNTDYRRLSAMLNLSNLNFDGIVASCFEGKAKPDVGIFMTAVRLAGVAPGECLFVDDVKEYCDRASALGMLSCHYRNFLQFRQELINLDFKLEGGGR